MSSLDTAWFSQLEDSIPQYLNSLSTPEQLGRYLPCKNGVTDVGREMALGWSCFALKTIFTLGQWHGLSLDNRSAWVEFIQKYQRRDGAFEDPPEIAWLNRPPDVKSKLMGMVGMAPWRPDPTSILLAETKQAIATLAQVGIGTSRTFRDFPTTPKAVRKWFSLQNWSKPWGAGGQSAGLVAFIETQSPMFLPVSSVISLMDACREFFREILDFDTGAYFTGAKPAHGEMINGAMKVLMALDWLDQPVHHPDRLIATTISQLPSPQGCHLVDAVYVIHQCLAGRPADRAVKEFCIKILEMIKLHANTDGGFSFNVKKAQTNYYGVEVSRGLEESDIQGTCLLTWAIAMIWKILDPATARWKLIKP